MEFYFGLGGGRGTPVSSPQGRTRLKSSLEGRVPNHTLSEGLTNLHSPFAGPGFPVPTVRLSEDPPLDSPLAVDLFSCFV